MVDLPEDHRDGAISEAFAEDFGEEAARFLLRDYSPTELDVISARIRGVRDPDLCQTLIEAEVALGPRQPVLAELNQQKYFLEQHPERARPVEALPQRDEPRDLPDREVVFRDADGEPYNRGTSAASKVQRMQRAEADGGEA